MPFGIGIDLGTARSTAAVYVNEEVTMIPQENGDYFLPSVVAFTENGVLIGQLAEEQAIWDPENTIVGVKRIMGKRFDNPFLQKFLERISYKVKNADGIPKIAVMYKGEQQLYDPEWISALILKKLKEKTEIILGHKAVNAVVTVPAFFNDSQRQATKDAASLAGLNVLQILNESTAAAIAYGLHKHSKGEKNVLVYNFGSGMFDACILKIKDAHSFETQATVGDSNLGGFEIDNALYDYCAELFCQKHNKNIEDNSRSKRRLRMACKHAKFNLSSMHEAVIDIYSLMDGIDFHLKISRSKFEELCEDTFKRTIELMHQVVVDSGLSKKDIDDVVLSGGCTKIPKIRELLTDYFEGKYVCESFNPSLVVSYGAAVRAAFLSGYKDRKIKDLRCVDVTPLSIGIETLGGIMTIVIERGTPIPVKASYTITTEIDNQEGVRIRVFEGERALTSDNHLLGTLLLTGLPSVPRGIPRVEVTFEIDSDGILTVSANELSAMKFDTAVIKLEKGRLSPESIESLLKKAGDFEEEDEILRDRFRYRRTLEHYVNTICKAAFTDKTNRISDRDKLEIKKICNEAREWLIEHPTDDVQKIIQKRSEVIKLLQPYAYRLDQSVVSREEMILASCNSGNANEHEDCGGTRCRKQI